MFKKILPIVGAIFFCLFLVKINYVSAQNMPPGMPVIPGRLVGIYDGIPSTSGGYPAGLPGGANAPYSYGNGMPYGGMQGVGGYGGCGGIPGGAVSVGMPVGAGMTQGYGMPYGGYGAAMPGAGVPTGVGVAPMPAGISAGAPMPSYGSSYSPTQPQTVEVVQNVQVEAPKPEAQPVVRPESPSLLERVAGKLLPVAIAKYVMGIPIESGTVSF